MRMGDLFIAKCRISYITFNLLQMKKIFTLKHSLFTFLCFSLLLATISCNDAKPKKAYAASLSGSEKTVALPQDDLKFLYDAYTLNLFNIKIAEEAMIRSTATESSALAEASAASAKKTNEGFSNLAIQYNLTLPPDINAEQKDAWKQLVKQKGWNFDKEYAVMAEKYLKAAEALFSNGTKSCKVKTLVSLATQGAADVKNQSALSVAQLEKIKERTTTSEEEQDDKVAAND